ncbi:MAG: hypothetical protein NTX15_09055 [Candidatus Kapabacteria bacterium]|nr:hypothetical protein [Candidatus Kapabacteria bacterium]
MPPSVKYAASALLLTFYLGTLVVPLAIVSVRWDVHRRVRSEIFAGITGESCVLFSLDKQSYSASLRDEGKELEVDGVLHDIVRLCKSRDRILVYCLQDDAETALTSSLKAKRIHAMQRDARGVALLSQLLNMLTPSVFNHQGVEHFLTPSALPFGDDECVGLCTNTFAPEQPPPESMT